MIPVFADRQPKAPVIEEHPRDQIIEQFSSGELHCRATGYPEPKIIAKFLKKDQRPISEFRFKKKTCFIWYKNGKPLDENEVAGSLIVSLGDLNFVSASARGTRGNNTDSGIYKCKAENQFGAVYSKSASVTIAWLDREFKLNPQPTITTVNKQVILKCLPPNGFPEPLVEWLFNGNPIQPQHDIIVTEKSDLLIKSVQYDHAGFYQCRAFQPELDNDGRVSSQGELVVQGK